MVYIITRASKFQYIVQFNFLRDMDSFYLIFFLKFVILMYIN